MLESKKILSLFFLILIVASTVPLVLGADESGANEKLQVPPPVWGECPMGNPTKWTEKPKYWACVAFVDVLGFPSNWWNNEYFAFYYGLVPLLGVFMIVYGFLEELRIFRRLRKINVWLAIIITLSTVPLRLYTYLTQFIFGLVGGWSVIIFAIIFAVGTWYYLVYKRGKWGSAAAVAQAESDLHKSVRNQLKDLREERRMLVEDLADATGKRFDELTKRIEKIDDQIRQIRSKKEMVEEVIG
jgi:hypothetical protein